MPYIKGIIAGVIALFGVSVGWGISETFRVKPLKLEVKTLNLTVSQHEAAQKANLETIEYLVIDQKQQQKLCADRLTGKARLSKKIIEIDNLRGVKNEKNYSLLTGDPILNRLNSLWDDKVDNDNSGFAASDSGSTGETYTLSCEVAKDHCPRPGETVDLYCLDEDGFINIIKNKEILYNYHEELRMVVEDMKRGQNENNK